MIEFLHLVELLALAIILKKLANLNRRIHKMATEAELDAKIAELKAEIAAAAQRVIDRINEVRAEHPDLSDELSDVSSAVEDLKKIGQPEAPPA